MKLNKKGFTIVELVIVIAVIAILAAVLIPTFSNVIDKAHESSLIQEGKSKFEEIYALDYSDGKLDKMESKGKDVTVPSGCTYEVENEKVKTFTYTKDGKTATFDGTNWTVGPAATPSQQTPAEE